ncbi:MAG: GNAT family N-acetyltransferase [Burkholderiales bacterium]
MQPFISRDLCIRPFRKTDGPSFVTAALESVSTVGVWMAWCHERFALKDAEAWFGACDRNLESGNAYDLGTFSMDGMQLLGGIAINQLNRRQNLGNIGYWVRQSCQRKGIATRAAQSIADYGFGQLKLTRLEIVAPESNAPSRRVAERVGAVLECIARNRVIVHGKPQPAAIYSLVPEQCGF